MVRRGAGNLLERWWAPGKIDVDLLKVNEDGMKMTLEPSLHRHLSI